MKQLISFTCPKKLRPVYTGQGNYEWIKKPSFGAAKCVSFERYGSYIKELFTPFCPARMLLSSSTLHLDRADYNMNLWC